MLSLVRHKVTHWNVRSSEEYHSSKGVSFKVQNTQDNRRKPLPVSDAVRRKKLLSAFPETDKYMCTLSGSGLHLVIVQIFEGGYEGFLIYKKRITTVLWKEW